MKELLPTIVCNTTAEKEHVAESERNIRVVKERNRGVVNNLPFTYIPRRMKIEFIYFVTLWINAFPVKSGVSETFSPGKSYSAGEWMRKSTVEYFLAHTVRYMTSQTPIIPL